jgi:hypothetical protein
MAFDGMNGNVMDGYSTGWTDFSSTSNPQGFASITTNYCYYKRYGKTVFIQVYILGVSNANTFTFTLPFITTNEMTWGISIVVNRVDNSTSAGGPGQIIIANNSTTATCYSTTSGSGWTAANNKSVGATFCYQTV